LVAAIFLLPVSYGRPPLALAGFLVLFSLLDATSLNIVLHTGVALGTAIDRIAIFHLRSNRNAGISFTIQHILSFDVISHAGSVC